MWARMLTTELVRMKKVERKLKRIDKLLNKVERRLLKATLILLNVKEKLNEKRPPEEINGPMDHLWD